MSFFPFEVLAMATVYIPIVNIPEYLYSTFHEMSFHDYVIYSESSRPPRVPKN